MPGPRVLVLDHTAQEGGAEIALLRLVETLQADQLADIRVLLFAGGPLRARLAGAGIRTAVLPLDERIATTSRERAIAAAVRSAAGALPFVARLVSAIRSSGAELVVANSLKSAVFASIAAPLAGRPWVWHLHDRIARDYLPGSLTTVMRLLADRGPREIVANSRATRRTLPRGAQSRTFVAYPGLPQDAFTRAEAAPETPVVGIIGRVSPTKGQREFLEAAALVAARLPDVRFAVIGGALFGEDDYELELHHRSRELGLGDRVDFTGWVSDASVRLRELTVLVHASPVPEPFGQVVVEAMAAGVAVVATAAGGVPEILDPAGAFTPSSGWQWTPTGILVSPGDVPALAAAIEAALRDSEGSGTTLAAAHADACDRFTIGETADRVLAVWRRTARRPRTIRRVPWPRRVDPVPEAGAAE